MPHDPSFDSNALIVSTDTTYAVQSDSVDNSPVVIEPSAGQLAQGLMRPGQQVGGQHFNWLMGQFANIFQALISNDVGHETRLTADETELANHEGRIVVAETWISTHSPRIKIYEYLTNGTITIPPRCTGALFFGCGGGGAGGGGADGVAVNDRWMAGGAGGGGALYTFQPIRLTVPGESLNVVVGLGGLQLGLGATGQDGGDSFVKRGPTAIVTSPGAQGGRGAIGPHVIPGIVHMTWPGMSVRGTNVILIGPAGVGIRYDTLNVGIGASGGFPQAIYIPMQAGQGGAGTGGSTMSGAAGAGSPNTIGGFLGGVGGVQGANFGAPPTAAGGGGGGGGGAGPFGNGGAGGSGSSSGGLTTGSTPGNAADNSGAGGGGAGSYGYVAAVPPHPLNAGNGGSGRVYIMTVEEL